MKFCTKKVLLSTLAVSISMNLFAAGFEAGDVEPTPKGPSTYPEGVPAEWMPWKDPDNNSVLNVNMDGTEDVFVLRRDTSEDPKREPGLINPQRYVAAMNGKNAFPTFFGSPMAFNTEDLKAGKPDVAVFGLTIDDNFIGGGSYAANKMRTLLDYTTVGSATDQMNGMAYFPMISVADYGNVNAHYGHSEKSLEEIHVVATEVLDADVMPVAIGGTHIQMYGMLTALAKKYGKGNVALIHFDSHYDALTAGMGRYVHNGSMIARAVDYGLLNGEDIIQVGLRSFGPSQGDLQYMKDNNFKFHFQAEVDKKGWEHVIKRVLEETKGKKVFLSFDLDVVDASAAPAVGTQEPGGLTAQEAMHMIRVIGAGTDLVAAEFNEYNPLLDDAHDTTGILMDRIIRSMFAGMAAKKDGIEDPMYLDPQRQDHAYNPEK
ncbi:arginase family protein [Vibrio sp. E150_011]